MFGEYYKLLIFSPPRRLKKCIFFTEQNIQVELPFNVQSTSFVYFPGAQWLFVFLSLD